MTQFRYRAVTPAGELIAGEIEAPSREEVLRRIEYVGNIAIEAEAAKRGMLEFGGTLFGARPTSRDVTVFLGQLALLLDAHLTLEAALQTLGNDAGKGLAKFAEALRESISAGNTFADALDRHPSIIDPAYVAMVQAGEASGNLESILHAIVEDRSRRQLLIERIGSAVRYPCFLVASAAAILVFFLVYVVPQFEPVFRDLGGRLNGGVTFVVAASTWLRTNLDPALGLCVALVLGGWLVLRQPRARTAMAGGIAKVPGIAGFVRDRRAARLIGTLGLLVGNGVALPTALKILRGMVTEPCYAEAAQRLHEQVRNGRRFADALAETDLLPPLAVRMLRVGDETGDLALIARHAAQFYEHRLSVSLNRLIGAVGPATIIFVSTLIGALIVSIMSALLSITDLAT